jgi:hypothetical protein
MDETVYSLRGFCVEGVQYLTSSTVYSIIPFVVLALDMK